MIEAFIIGLVIGIAAGVVAGQLGERRRRDAELARFDSVFRHGGR